MACGQRAGCELNWKASVSRDAPVSLRDDALQGRAALELLLEDICGRDGCREREIGWDVRAGDVSYR
jgi:hypothetical protein